MGGGGGEVGKLGELRLDYIFCIESELRFVHALGGEAGSDGNRIHIVTHDLLCKARG